MNVLVLEDQATASHYVIEYIRDKLGHNPILARSLKDADQKLEDAQIDCIVADTNMPAEGFTDEEQEQSELGKFTGWLWLSNYVFPEHPDLKPRTVIYSAYLDDLRDSFAGDLKDIRLVDKSPAKGGVRKLQKYLEEIAAELSRTA